ncbi:MAG: hypothetical protein K9M14_03680, partial [Candidatus Omnitrophica bacterium]|nr:hypothetical protein [Candidatus Omnitrophota bacterium]
MFGINFFLISEIINVSVDTVLNTALFFTLSIIIIFLYIVKKLKIISHLKETISNLNGSLERLDQQAKIILKSDMD